MCGIAGWFSTQGEPAATHEPRLLAMVAALAHRGPDGRHGLCTGPTALGHARLAIVGLDNGRQPLSSPCGRLHLVCNGEIYNHHELRNRLRAQGEQFLTDSDCEVILPLYRRHGLAFVQHLRGAFALALWDEGTQQLVLARDAAGQRPLFYAQAGSRLLFASEAKALFAWPQLQARLDAASVAHVFTTWAPRPQGSAFEGVHALPPGHLATVGLNGEPKLQCWWDWPYVQCAGAAPSAARQLDMEEQLEAALSHAVGLQLQADVPVAAYLSGGLDSSLLCAMAQPLAGGRLQSFGLRFTQAGLDEGEHQQALARHLGLRHTEVPISAAELAQAFTQAVWQAEAPLVRTAPVPMMLLAKATRAHGIKVVLSGEGADETFAGYDSFKLAALRAFVARAGGSAARKALLQRLYPQLSVVGQTWLLGAARPGQPLEAQALRMAAGRRALQLAGPLLREAMAAQPLDAAALDSSSATWPALSRWQHAEAHTLLSGQLLSTQGDRMAMAHGVEQRMPYLDEAVLALACGLPPALKLRGLCDKILLRRLAAKRLPAALAWRRKQAYRAPESSVFFAGPKPLPWVRDALEPKAVQEAGLFEPQGVARLLLRCASRPAALGDADHIALVGVLSTMLLQRQYVQGHAWTPGHMVS